MKYYQVYCIPEIWQDSNDGVAIVVYAKNKRDAIYTAIDEYEELYGKQPYVCHPEAYYTRNGHFVGLK